MDMRNPHRRTTEQGIKTISCSWSHADYTTSLYKLKNGGVGRVCDCKGFFFKRRCKHLFALEEWARQHRPETKPEEKRK